MLRDSKAKVIHPQSNSRSAQSLPNVPATPPRLELTVALSPLQEFGSGNESVFNFGKPQRVAPRDRILFLKQFVIAADMPDDHTARSHRRERQAYAELTDSEDDLD